MDYILTIAILLTIYAILASSLNVVLGHGGLLSLCHAGFYAIGAYAAALLGVSLGVNFFVTVIFAALVAAAFAALLAVPLLRLRGDYFILGSLGFQIIIIDAIYNSDWLTNGALGIGRIPRPNVLGFEVQTHLQYAVLYSFVACIWILGNHYITTAAFGRALHAVREDEVAASSLGKNVRSIRVRAFAISAAGAGVAGALYAHFTTYIDTTSFTFTESVYILSLVVVGGVATTSGPVLGALILVALPEMLRFVGFSSGADANLRQLIYGMLLIGFAMLRPRGLAGKNVF
jgi:branched-chain amino acid transport system permease protein